MYKVVASDLAALGSLYRVMALQNSRHTGCCSVFWLQRSNVSQEGRVITLEFEKFFLVNVYKPSCANLGRLSFRQEFDEAFLGYVSDKRSQLQKPAILCGDFNVAHSVCDLPDYH